jgi:hypothetical protein
VESSYYYVTLKGAESSSRSSHCPRHFKYIMREDSGE